MEFSRVFDPLEYPMEELELDHPIFHQVFELKEKPQVPAPQHWLNYGRSWERPAGRKEPHYWAVYDKKNDNRMMAIICHNTDLGDGWEREGMSKDYFDEMSVKRGLSHGDKYRGVRVNSLNDELETIEKATRAVQMLGRCITGKEYSCGSQY